MRKPKPPHAKWGSLDDVRGWYQTERNALLKTKLNAIRLLMEGVAVRDVALAVGTCVATVRNWRARWDQVGKEGLNEGRKGPVSRITPEMRAEIKQFVEVTREIDGKRVTGKLIVGYLKKNTSCT